MGLQEKRLIKDFQDSKLPGLIKEIEKFVACPVDIDWDTLTMTDGVDSSYWADSWVKVYFDPIISGFKEIASDDMGREALKDGVKKIEICNKSDQYGPSGITFNGGVLRIDHKPCTNVDYGHERAQQIVTVLSKAL